MAAQILPFPKPIGGLASPLACFVRIGEAHKKLSDIHAAGHLPARRVVIEASRYRFQRELVSALRETGAEIVLDTEAAELAAPAKAVSHSRRAPWARPPNEGLLGPDHFRKSAAVDIVGQIARFAVENHIPVVLAPTHFVGDPSCADWPLIDREACLALRASLDREGGRKIAIDYSIIVPNTLLNDAMARDEMFAPIADLPVDNIWIRASGLGSDAGPLTMRRYLSALAGLHKLGKPIVADYLGGIPAFAALAFGAIAGVAQGIGERERFDAGSWHKPPVPRDDDAVFGRAVRINIPGLHRSATRMELDLLVSAKGGRRLCGCNDRGCCPHGYVDMIADPRRHAAQQLFKSMSALEAVPDLRRESYFVNGPMSEADRLARSIKALRPSALEAEKRGINPGDLMKRFDQHSRRVEQLQSALERLHESRGEDGPRSRAIAPRSSQEQRIRKDQPWP